MSKSSFGGDFRNGGILNGLRVVKCGEGISAAFASKMMADLGADVIKVEEPSGDIIRRRGPFAPGEEPDPEKSGLFLYLNANKRGVSIDLTAPNSKPGFDRLLSSAGILIHNFQSLLSRDSRTGKRGSIKEVPVAHHGRHLAIRRQRPIQGLEGLCAEY